MLELRTPTFVLLACLATPAAASDLQLASLAPPPLMLPSPHLQDIFDAVLRYGPSKSISQEMVNSTAL
jgi:hypothetical protein